MKKNRFIEWILHKDSLMLVFILLFIWITISALSLQFMDLSNLKMYKGRITDSEIVITRIKKRLFYSDTTKQMRIYLNGESDFFVLPSNNNYQEFDSLYIDDSVKVYVKEKMLGFFGFNPRLVYHMVREEDQQIFVNVTHQKRQRSGIWVIGVVATFVFSLWYLYKTVRRMQ